MCVCVCEREKERERETGRQTDRQSETETVAERPRDKRQVCCCVELPALCSVGLAETNSIAVWRGNSLVLKRTLISRSRQQAHTDPVFRICSCECEPSTEQHNTPAY